MFSGADVAYELASFTLEYLVQLDDRGRVIPVLCDRIPTAKNGGISKDGLTVTYHLRRGVTWSDGQPFTAQDVIASWKQVMNPLNNVVIREGYDVVARIEAPDPHTAIVHLKHPYAPLPTRFFAGIQEGPIPVMPAHIIAAQGDLNHSAFNEHPIGTGPFIVKSWLRNDRMTFVANPHYWRGRPKIEKIIFRAQPSAATELVGLRTHENDADVNAGAGRLPEYKSIDGVKIVQYPSLGMTIAVMNTQRFPFSDVHVRRAFAHALDRAGILHRVLHDSGVLADEFLPIWSWAHSTNVPHYGFDVKKAVAELDSGGYTLRRDGFRYHNGQRVSAVIVGVSGSTTQAKEDAVIQDALRSVGIESTIKTYPYSIVFDIVGPIRQGNFDVTVYNYSVNYDPSALKDDGCDQIAPKGSNVDRYCDPVVGRLERQALATNDQTRRKPLYAEIEKRRMTSVSSLPIAFIDRVSVFNSDLHGYTPSRGIIPEWNAWQWSIP